MSAIPRESYARKRKERVGIAFFDPSLNHVLTEDEWRRVEAAYGCSLSPKLRAKIRKALTTFLQTAPTEIDAAFKHNVERHLRKIEATAKALLATLTAGSAPAAELDSAEVAQAKIDTLLARYRDPPSVRGIVRTLKNLSHASEQARNDLPHEKGFKEGDAWGGLIDRLASIMRDAGLPNGIANMGNSKFVALFRCLQSTFPSQLRRHDRAGEESFAREMNRARKRASDKERNTKVLTAGNGPSDGTQALARRQGKSPY